jgi:hypothetical protein
MSDPNLKFYFRLNRLYTPLLVASYTDVRGIEVVGLCVALETCQHPRIVFCCLTFICIFIKT